MIPIIDGHNDALLRAWRSGESLHDRSEDGQLDLVRMREGGIAAGYFAIFVPEDDEPGDPRANVEETEDGWEVPYPEPLEAGRGVSIAQEIAAIAERDLDLIRTVEDLERCIAGGDPGAILHLEGAEPLDPTLRDLDAWVERGVRSIGVVWSRPNAFGQGVPFRFPGSPDDGPGLTEAGRELVRACNERGVLVDLAHLNERGFFDVAALSDAPLVVTHAGAHAIAPQPRNLTDAQLDTIGDSGGLVGVFFDVVMTRNDGDLIFDTPLDVIAEHIDYVAERIGLEHVALGSDFDGCFPPAALGDASKTQDLLGVLGWNDDELEKLAHGNWLRVLRATWA
ncbi:MAG: rane dipeptidase [Gaiellaceae bacterium]|nr:rane dipeptidase [Gaiellaceae bacterium]